MIVRDALRSIPTPFLWCVLVVALGLGAAFAARVPPQTGTIAFAVACALVVALFSVEIRLRTAERNAAPATGHGVADPDVLLARLREGIDELSERLESGSAEDLKERIEALVVETIEPLADARDRLVATLGMGRAAEILTRAATCERWLNRAWSALTDGDRDEAREALANAGAGLGTAR